MQAIGRQPQRAPDGAPAHYERHRLEQTTLYRLVQQHAATFFAQAEAKAGADLPQFVKDAFDAFLECGILAHGFLRLRCGDCGHDKLVAFSCKRRGFCPSCGARRMAQTAAHLVEHALALPPGRSPGTNSPPDCLCPGSLPHKPVRQWVLALHIPPSPGTVSPLDCASAQALAVFTGGGGQFCAGTDRHQTPVKLLDRPPQPAAHAIRPSSRPGRRAPSPAA